MVNQTFSETFKIEDVTGAVVLVKLISVEHVAARTDEVDDEFELEVTVTDGGRNKKGKFGPETVKISNGSKFTPDKFIFTGDYDSKSVGEIKFKFEAETDSLSGEFIGVTTENNTLKPGIQQFSAPVTLESGGKKSTLIFRGRIDLSA